MQGYSPGQVGTLIKLIQGLHAHTILPTLSFFFVRCGIEKKKQKQNKNRKQKQNKNKSKKQKQNKTKQKKRARVSPLSGMCLYHSVVNQYEQNKETRHFIGFQKTGRAETKPTCLSRV